MANIAQNYHNNVQLIGINRDPSLKEEATQEVLNNIQIWIDPEHFTKLESKMTTGNVLEALRLSANNKAPGLDGIPYEVWKSLKDRSDSVQGTDKKALDIIKVLTMVYNDIETHGIVKGTNFSESWMCPLYKKNDKSDIANYRPISLLNSDYKIFTKALTIKLAKAAPNLIDPAQAGFVPGRHIYDQIWLSKLVINLAEATEHNGAIIALDQEKAYDKIEHEYLWRTLDKFGFPMQFINTVKALYSDAHTYVMVNGEKSPTPFKVIRGIRQGDPLSCLLFDLAIEPLAKALHRSTLEGIQIPGVEKRLIATLFADDTTTYLSHNDNFGDLVKILDKWCMASGAKFNISKTKIIPIGTEEHRQKVSENRYLNGVDGTPIPDHIKIAKDGEAIRSLGAMIGNKVNPISPWSRILEKIDTSLEIWDKGHPTIEGRRLIILMVVGGMTQYLTKVQGMPKEIEEKLERRIRAFLWDDKTHLAINKETLMIPIEEDGRKLLDILSCNEAITITWLKLYLNLDENRPTWAYVADAIMAKHTPASEENVDERARINVFLQS